MNERTNPPLPPLPLLGSVTIEPLTFNVHAQIELDAIALHNPPRRVVIGSLEVGRGARVPAGGFATGEWLREGTYLAVYDPAGFVTVYDGTQGRTSVMPLAGEVAAGFEVAYRDALEVEAEIARVAGEPEEGKGAPWLEE